MKIDDTLLDELTAQAKASPRLRMNYDLRTSPESDSQRMLNAIEPGSVIPIHRHMDTTEMVVLVRGRAIQYHYDNEGNVTEEILLEAGGPCRMMIVEVGQWHRFQALESGTVIATAMDGRYQPTREEDVMRLGSKGSETLG